MIVIKVQLSTHYSAKKEHMFTSTMFQGRLHLFIAIDVPYKIPFCFSILWRTSMKQEL